MSVSQILLDLLTTSDQKYQMTATGKGREDAAAQGPKYNVSQDDAEAKPKVCQSVGFLSKSGSQASTFFENESGRLLLTHLC
jgi:hypothetical protein